MAFRIDEDGVFVDVGANIGNHTIYLAAITGCRVKAFEPNQELVQVMESSISANKLENLVQVYTVGIGSEPGWASFEKEIHGNTGAQKLEARDRQSGEIEIQTLDSIIGNEKIDIIKIDVEGMELDVIRGAKEVLKNSEPLIYAEAQNLIQFRTLCRELGKYGYTPIDVFGLTPTHLFIPDSKSNDSTKIAAIHNRLIQQVYKSNQMFEALRQDHNKVLRELERLKEINRQS